MLKKEYNFQILQNKRYKERNFILLTITFTISIIKLLIKRINWNKKWKVIKLDKWECWITNNSNKKI